MSTPLHYDLLLAWASFCYETVGAIYPVNDIAVEDDDTLSLRHHAAHAIQLKDGSVCRILSMTYKWDGKLNG